MLRPYHLQETFVGKRVPGQNSYGRVDSKIGQFLSGLYKG